MFQLRSQELDGVRQAGSSEEFLVNLLQDILPGLDGLALTTLSKASRIWLFPDCMASTSWV